jgi:hypothetical protein
MNQLKILEIFNKNKSKKFVKRIINADEYPAMQLRDGSESTHAMEWRESGGRFLVYPTIIYKKVTPALMKLEQVSGDMFRVIQQRKEDGLTRLDSDAAFAHAKSTKEYISFTNVEDADEFLRDWREFSNRFYSTGAPKEKIYPKRETIWKDMNTGPGTIDD